MSFLRYLDFLLDNWDKGKELKRYKEKSKGFKIDLNS